MTETKSESKNNRGEKYLVGLGAIVGAIVSGFYDMVKSIIMGQTESYFVDAAALIVTILIFYGVLRVAYRQSSKRAESPPVPKTRFDSS